VLVCVARKTAGHSRSRGTGPEPAVPAWAHGTDGVGPALLSPDGAPARRLLMDGYVYDIRDDHDHPPGRKFLSGLVDVEADDRPTGGR
jgi:hypothetical protein